MLTRHFFYHLPKHLIAQAPVKPRDHSRLLVLNRKQRGQEHHYFYELPNLLRPGDVLVFNNSLVFKARLLGKKESGGKIEIFLLRPKNDYVWEVLIGSQGALIGQQVKFQQGLQGKIIAQNENVWQMQFNQKDTKLQRTINNIGIVPLPPYIKQKAPLAQYQTVYALKRGSVAAPTAGLHFSKRLLTKLEKKGVQLEYLTLHVGLGTFQPIKMERIEEHHIHSETALLDVQTSKRLNQAKKESRRIIAVGTTTVRTLEAFAQNSPPLRGGVRGGVRNTKPSPNLSLEERRMIYAGQRDINLYITPGYKFKFVDGMITNFHLPCSSLLVLVAAFAGREKILSAYRLAIKKGYRFYSFGDAMLII